MLTLFAPRVPSGEAHVDLINVLARHNISFVSSTDPNVVVGFLKKDPGFKEVGSPETTLPNKPGDEAISSVDHERPSFRPESHLETNGSGNSDAQKKSSSPNTLEIPQAIDAFSHQKQNKDTVVQNPPTTSAETNGFGQVQEQTPDYTSNDGPFVSAKIVSDTKIIQKSVEEVLIGANISTKQPEVKEEYEQSYAVNKLQPEVPNGATKTPSPKNSIDQIFTAPENRFGNGIVVPEAKPQHMEFNMPPFASPAPMDYEELIDIFDGIKPPIDLDAPRLFLGEIDLTEESVKDTVVKEEMEDGEEFGDAGQHLAPKDRSSAKKVEPDVTNVGSKTPFPKNSIPQEFHQSDAFSNSSEPRPLRQDYSHQMQNMDPAIENPPPFPSGSDVFDRDLQKSPLIFTTPENRFGSSKIVPEVNLDFEMNPIGLDDGLPEPVNEEEFEKTATFSEDLTEGFDALEKEDSDEEEEESEAMNDEEEKEEREDGEEESSHSEAQVDPKDKEFKPKVAADLKKRAKKYKNPKIFSCDVCARSFNGSYDLKRHYRIHTGERSFKCKVCHRKFARRDYLTSHLRAHDGEMPFRCGVCQMLFTRKCSLVAHMLTHSGEKPFQCDICKQRFRARNTLNNHMRGHTGEEPYECKMCLKKFRHLKDLKKHRGLVHP